MSERDPAWCKDCRLAPVQIVDGSPRTRCKACASKRAEAARTRRAAQLERGRCAWPGHCPQRAAKGRTMCREHLAYYVGSVRRYRARK